VGFVVVVAGVAHVVLRLVSVVIRVILRGVGDFRHQFFLKIFADLFFVAHGGLRHVGFRHRPRLTAPAADHSGGQFRVTGLRHFLALAHDHGHEDDEPCDHEGDHDE
jgi:hypothetical protein